MENKENRKKKKKKNPQIYLKLSNIAVGELNKVYWRKTKLKAHRVLKKDDFYIERGRVTTELHHNEHMVLTILSKMSKLDKKLVAIDNDNKQLGAYKEQITEAIRQEAEKTKE